MQQDIEKMQLFYEYYKQWIDVYKKVQSEKSRWLNI